MLKGVRMVPTMKGILFDRRSSSLPLTLYPDLLKRKRTHFLLWRPRHLDPVPKLRIGVFQPGNPPSLAEEQLLELDQSAVFADLWEIKARNCNLVDGRIYHYWFRVRDGHPQADHTGAIDCTDPTAEIVDWRLRAAIPGPPYTDDDRMPAGVVKFKDQGLIACDPDGEEVSFTEEEPGTDLPPNNKLVLYELPTRWSRTGVESSAEIGVGTFRDVLALIDPNAGGANFAGVSALATGRSYLRDLGVNGLELLPIADSFADRSWGYATSNYFAPDFDLGRPQENISSTAAGDFTKLVEGCHTVGMRFFDDMVMAFSTRGSTQFVNYLDFFVEPGTGDPEEDGRNGFGGDLFKYNFFTDSYDPISGERIPAVPARQLMKAQLARWILDFHIDGIRMDSVNNIMNHDFVQEFKDYARDLWRKRWQEQNDSPSGAEERFLVVGEELSEPPALLQQNRLDGLWHEQFKRILRNVILGKNDDNEPSFEWSVRKLIDCRLLGYNDGAQAINYVTSHDVQGPRNERLFNYLQNNRVVFKEKQIKLAFVCLLTAVGIPMILAGEEFADQHDLSTGEPGKELDAVNFERVDEPWRNEVLQYVSRLVKFRTMADALSVNDTAFLHVDFNDGKRVVVWQRGRPENGNAVVVIANFSDFQTADASNPNSEYVVPNWPALPPGKKWREISQGRDLPASWAGREPIFPWEAKVYAMVPVG